MDGNAATGRSVKSERDHEAACVAAHAAVMRATQARQFEQFKIEDERRKNIRAGQMESEQEIAQELAEKVGNKFREARRLLEDLGIDYQNNLVNNNYQVDFIEACDRLADDLIASIRAGSVSIVN